MTAFGFQLRKNLNRHRPPHWPLALVTMIAVAVFAVGWAWIIRDDGYDSLNAIRSARRPLFVWRENEDAFALALALAVFGFMAVSSMFSAPDAVKPRHAWWGLVIWAALLVGVNAATAGGTTGGYADATGATWVSGSRIAAHRPWSSATQVVAGCEHRMRKARAHNVIRYDVRFGGRSAELAAPVGPDGAARWLSAVRVAEKAIPKGAKFSRSGLAVRCISYFAQDLDLEGDETLVAVFRPTSDHVQRAMRESAAWGALFEKVRAQQAAGS